MKVRLRIAGIVVLPGVQQLQSFARLQIRQVALNVSGADFRTVFPRIHQQLAQVRFGLPQPPGLSPSQPGLALCPLRITAQLLRVTQQRFDAFQVAQPAMRAGQQETGFRPFRRQPQRDSQLVQGPLVVALVQELAGTAACGIGRPAGSRPNTPPPTL